MATYSDWQQRELDIAMSEEVDRVQARVTPCRPCRVCGNVYHLWCNREPVDQHDRSEP